MYKAAVIVDQTHKSLGLFERFRGREGIDRIKLMLLSFDFVNAYVITEKLNLFRRKDTFFLCED